MPIKAFRGLLVHGAQERIRLVHIDGKTGYKLRKLQVITENPAAETAEIVVKVYSIKQTAIDALINMSEQTLLGTCYYEGHSNSTDFGGTTIIIDGVTINQDIFVTLSDGSGGSIGGNFYLELESIALDDMEATAAILKNFRNTNSYAT